MFFKKAVKKIWLKIKSCPPAEAVGNYVREIKTALINDLPEYIGFKNSGESLFYKLNACTCLKSN